MAINYVEYYVRLVKAGLDMEKVPKKWRAAVEEALNEEKE